MTVFIEIPADKVKIIEKYSKKNDISLQDLFLDAVLRQIESESDVGSFTNLLTKYTEDDTEYSFNELDVDE